MKMPEKLLHFIWRYKLFNQSALTTKEGFKLEIIAFGLYNHDAGPDFEFAQIRLDDTVWSGHVEMHVNEDEWYQHGHHLDPHYDSTIIHVVWNRGEAVARRTDGTSIPTLILERYVDEKLLEKYSNLMDNLLWIPCEKQLQTVPSFVVHPWLDRVVVERLEEKIRHLQVLADVTQQDWEKVFMVSLARAFGMKVNATPFEDWMLRLDLNLLRKYKDDPLKIESLCFGLAGFLNSEPIEEYPNLLLKEYAYLSKIHQLKSMSSSEWKFMRMRPYNFPAYRMAQIIALLQNSTHWFERLRKAEQLASIFEEISVCLPHIYWQTHFRFGKETQSRSIAWTAPFLYHLAINAIIPILYKYGMDTDQETLKDKALRWLSEIPAERNSIIKKFASYGIQAAHASDSQALLFLHKNYCTNKRCLECAIGLNILKN